MKRFAKISLVTLLLVVVLGVNVQAGWFSSPKKVADMSRDELHDFYYDKFYNALMDADLGAIKECFEQGADDEFKFIFNYDDGSQFITFPILLALNKNEGKTEEEIIEVIDYFSDNNYNVVSADSDSGTTFEYAFHYANPDLAKKLLDATLMWAWDMEEQIGRNNTEYALYKIGQMSRDTSFMYWKPKQYLRKYYKGFHAILEGAPYDWQYPDREIAMERGWTDENGFPKDYDY